MPADLGRVPIGREMILGVKSDPILVLDEGRGVVAVDWLIELA